MRKTIILWALGLSWMPMLTRAESATVLAAVATSSASDSTPITCLLKTDCRGNWSPGSLDSGANEGVYVQFEKPVAVDAVELETTDKPDTVPFVLSINGAPATGESAPKQVGAQNERTSAVRYAIPGSQVKSVFFRLGVRKGGWQHFSLRAIRFYRHGKPVKMNMPTLIPATVTATSTLEPRVAYQPANLFDSRYDFAWSTNGKTTKGPGESLQIHFATPQNLSGMLVWDGYQRSNSHYQANGRITRMTVTSDQVKQDIVLADRAGAQKVMLSEPLKKVSSLRLTIDAIAPGKKYKDVLISELRFIDDQGRIVLPQVEGMMPTPNALTAKLVGRSLSSLACSSSVMPGNFQRSFRLRKDGSFVIYAKAYDSDGKKTDRVLEGSWEQQGANVRIFGKRYAETVLQTDYALTKTKVPASIFQSDLMIARFKDLKPRAQQQLAALIWSRLVGTATGADGEKLVILGTDNQVLASGKDEKTLLVNFIAMLKQRNPWTIQSPILADAMLPSDEIGACETSH